MQKLPGIILRKVNYKESYNFPHNTLCKKFRNVLHLYVPLQESVCTVYYTKKVAKVQIRNRIPTATEPTYKTIVLGY